MAQFDLEELVRAYFALAKIVEPEELLNGGSSYSYSNMKLSVNDDSDFSALTIDLKGSGLWGCFADREIFKVSVEGLESVDEDAGAWLNEELFLKVRALEALASVR